MADINKILNKKGWTGRELGILELTNMAVQFKQTLLGQEVKPIVEDAKLSEMVSRIKDPKQGAMYNNYIAIHEWLSVQYNISQTQLQQAQLQYQILFSWLSQITLSEDFCNYIGELPVIMTEKQYSDIKAEKIEEYFTDEDGKDLYYDVFTLLCSVIDYFLPLLEKDPKAPNPLKAIKKKYEKEPVKSKLILERWNEVIGAGYYTLPDGRRSDQMTNEEWQEALTTPKMKQALAEYDAVDEEGDIITNEVTHFRLQNRARVLFNGGTKEEADEAQMEADHKAGLTVPCEWHTYTEPPTDLTKWDVIEEGVLQEIYPASLDGEDPYTASNFTASMEDLIEEFSELVKAILEEVDKHYFKDEEKLSSLPISKWESTVHSRRQLYNVDFYGIKADAEGDLNVFGNNPRAVFNGVAIVRANDAVDVSKHIDKNGYFQEPSIEDNLSGFSLSAFFPESPHYIENAESVESARNTLLDSYYFLTGYNYVIDQIASIHDVPDVKIFKFSLDLLNNKMDVFNDCLSVLYERIQYSSYGDNELKEKKLQALRDFFQPIEYESITLPEASKDRATKIIEDFSAFKPENGDVLANLLYTRPTDSTEEVWKDM